MISRIIKSTVCNKNLLTNSSKAILNNPLFKINKMNFSAKDNLINCFQQELEYEEKEYKPLSEEEKSTIYQNNGFEFIESKSSAKMQLKKTVNDYVVDIHYFARSPLGEDEEEQNNEQGESPNNVTDIQILIYKQGQSNGFFVNAMIIDSKVNINTIQVSDNVQEYNQKYSSGLVEPDVYQGPDFYTLDENLKQAFSDFMYELGINEECSSFIEYTSLQKDHSLYINWLKNAKNVLL